MNHHCVRAVDNPEDPKPVTPVTPVTTADRQRYMAAAMQCNLLTGPHQMQSNINTTRAQLDSLNTQRLSLDEQAKAIRDEVAKLSAQITEDERTLNGACSLSARQQATTRRHAAMSKRSELTAQGQAIQRDGNALALRRLDLEKAISRAEYEAVTDSDLKRLQAENAEAVKAASVRLDTLRRDLDSLKSRRQEAQAAVDAIRGAECNLSGARQALDRERGQAFINGSAVDLSALENGVTLATAALNDCRLDAGGAAAAIPLIDDLIETATANLEAENEAFSPLVAAHYDIQLRKAERAYIRHVHAMLDSVQTLVALDDLTGKRLGDSLLDTLRRGLKLPVVGKHTEPLDTSPWFGSGLVPNVSEAVQRLKDELHAVNDL